MQVDNSETTHLTGYQQGHKCLTLWYGHKLCAK
jgi:hypothetical protein